MQPREILFPYHGKACLVRCTIIARTSSSYRGTAEHMSFAPSLAWRSYLTVQERRSDSAVGRYSTVQSRGAQRGVHIRRRTAGLNEYERRRRLGVMDDSGTGQKVDLVSRGAGGGARDSPPQQVFSRAER